MWTDQSDDLRPLCLRVFRGIRRSKARKHESAAEVVRWLQRRWWTYSRDSRRLNNVKKWWVTQANQLSHQTTAGKAALPYLLTAIPNISTTEKPAITLQHITILLCVNECPCIMSACQISPKHDYHSEVLITIYKIAVRIARFRYDNTTLSIRYINQQLVYIYFVLS